MMLKEKDFIKNTASGVAMEEGWQTNHKTRGENVLGKLIEFERGKIKEALVKKLAPSGAPFSAALSHETTRRLTAPRPIGLVRRRQHKMAANYSNCSKRTLNATSQHALCCEATRPRSLNYPQTGLAFGKFVEADSAFAH